MHILVANDDGYLSPGIRALHDGLRAVGSPTTVAPDRNRSGASNSLTLQRPLTVHQHADDVYSVQGTPTDCVHVSLGGGFLPHEPNMVVSGINDGPNMGDDVLYSGTVAAAVEGRSLGQPAIAVSMAQHNPDHYDTAVEVVVNLIRQMQQVPLPADTILNVNVPDVPMAELQGQRVTRLGSRHPSQKAHREQSPRGDYVYWIGAAGDIADAGPGTDFLAVEEGFVSVTPLQIDLTRFDAMQALSEWLEHVS